MESGINKFYVKNDSSGKIIIKFQLNHITLVLSEELFLMFSTSCIRAYDELLHLKENNINLPYPQILTQRNIGHNLLAISYNNNHFCIRWKDNSIVLNDFNSFVNDIYDFLNEKYSKGILNIRNLDPIYLEHMLCVDLPYLMDAHIEDYKILDLNCYDSKHNSHYDVTKTEYYKKIRDNNVKLTSKDSTNHLYETDISRLQRVYQSIINKGYPYKDNYIIIYNNDHILRDGTRRLACLYHEFGNINIKVLKLLFSQNYYSVSMFRKNILNNGKKDNK